MKQVEDLYSRYLTEGYEEYNKLHSCDAGAEAEAIEKPF